MEIDTLLAIPIIVVILTIGGAIGYGLGYGNVQTTITACPLQETKVIQDKPCSEETLNDCLRVYRTVHKLGECAENKYCEGLR